MLEAKTIGEDNFIKKIQSGDERALDYVIDVYGGMIRGIVRKRLSALPDQWEECENDVLLAVWNEIGHFDRSKNSFAGWLAAVCRYKAIDRLRRAARRKDELPFSEDGPETTLPEAGPSPALTCELRGEISDLLSNLSEDDRRLFLDLFENGEPAERIARERHMKLSALYNRISRGRKKLRQCKEAKE